MVLLDVLTSFTDQQYWGFASRRVSKDVRLPALEALTHGLGAFSLLTLLTKGEQSLFTFILQASNQSFLTLLTSSKQSFLKVAEGAP